MKPPEGYIRVSHRRRCPVCQRPDWCLIHADGASAICPRTYSDRSWGEAGFLHILDENAVKDRKAATIQRRERPMLLAPDAAVAKYEKNLDLEQSTTLAASLGVSVASLVALRCGWSHQYGAFTFPMYNGLRQIIGIRIRNEAGQKWAAPGSRNGLFVPLVTAEQFSQIAEWWVVEGPTDTAACLTLGLWAIGRPSCSGGVQETVALLTGKNVTIVGNYDTPKQRPNGTTFYPGQEGAIELAEALTGRARRVRMIYPRRPHKDVREWVNAGATREEIEMVATNAGAWVRRSA